MYQVFCDNKLIIDSRIDELAVVNPIVDVGANIAGSFTFTFPSVHPFINEINRLTSVVRVERDDKIIFQGFCSGDSFDIFGSRKITCEGDLSYLNDSILRPARYQGETVLSLLTKYINQHNAQVEERKRFEIGTVTVTDPNDYIYCFTNMNSTMQEIKEDLIDDLGGFMRVRYDNGHRYIDYLASSLHDASQTIELGKNIVDYNSNINESDLATRVIPLGVQLENQVIEGLDTRLDIKSVNSGLDYLESQSAVNNFGIITKTIIFDDVTTPSILKTKGQQYLNSAQFEKVFISIKAVDLSLLSNHYNPFKLLDNVRIISDKHGLDSRFLLTSIKYNLNSPEKDVLTFGQSVVKSISAKTTQLSLDAYNLKESVNEAAWLTQAKKEATDLISGADGGYVVMNVDQNDIPYEILVMDAATKETAQKVWRWNQNGFGYSSTGYNGTYGTAITMNGQIVADYIKTGTLRSIQIDNGTNHQFVVDSQGNVTAKSMIVQGVGKFYINGYEASGDLPMFAINNTKRDGTTVDCYLDTIGLTLGKHAADGSVIGHPTSILAESGWLYVTDVWVYNNLGVMGTKSRIVKTDDYDTRLLYSYETPRPTFADEGHAILDEEGICYIYLDDVFIETVDLTHDYRVFLTKYGEGDIWVEEVTPYYITVKGTPELEFDWKIDCIQRNYNLVNMEKFEQDTYDILDVDYGGLADEYLKEFNFEEEAA